MSRINWLGRFPRHSFNSLGWSAFQAGLFLLPSSALLSAFFLVLSIILGGIKRPRLYWKDPWNFPFFIAGVLMFCGCLRAYSGWLAWVGLANWLPFFWGFWGFQPYLATTEQRKKSAYWLLAGTVPVVVTGFGQLWWGWEGPWQLFNGLIIWFVAPGGEPSGRLSGLFDYANIAGAWLSVVWPFSLALLLESSLKVRERSFALVLAVGIVAALVLTDSRNAWGGLLLAIPFVVGPARWFWLLPLLAALLTPVVVASLPWFGFELQQWARQIVPQGIWSRLNDMQYAQERVVVSTRLSQWKVAIDFIVERPWLGWGAAAFSVLYPSTTGQWHGHAHNLPIELAVSHGLPVAILVVGTVMALLITALKRGVLVNGGQNELNRAWWTACFILVVLHGADIPFFDGRLNMVGWILLAGLRCLIVPANSIQSENPRLVVDVESKSPF